MFIGDHPSLLLQDLFLSAVSTPGGDSQEVPEVISCRPPTASITTRLLTLPTTARWWGLLLQA